MKETQYTTADFTDQTLFIGIDVHKHSWHVALRMGRHTLKSLSLDPKPETLSSYLRTRYPGARYVSCYEAGCFGFWIHEQLCRLGIENRVIHAADIPTSDKERTYKTDRRDAAKLARELENGSLHGIYIPSMAHQQLRALWRLRFRLVGEQTRYKNRIKSFMTFFGYELPPVRSHWSRAFIEGLLELEGPDEAGRLVLQYLIESLRQLRARIARLTQELSRLVPASTLALLMSIPGIGRITALALYGELYTLERFETIAQLCSYLGLIPTTRSSGSHEDSGRLTPRRNRYLRALLIEAAWASLQSDPALLAYHLRLKGRMKSQDAIVRVAKKLARRLWRVWRSGEPYRCGVAT